MLAKKKSKSNHTSIRDVEGIYLPTSDQLNQKDRHTFEVMFLGIVPDIVMTSCMARDPEAQLVDRIEEAQIEGRLPISLNDEGKVKINISLHGIKVIDMNGQEVLQRHPLQTIAQVVQYTDGNYINYITFKIGNVNKSVFSAYLFQCLNQDQAQLICQSVKAMFDAVTAKHR